MSSFKSAISSLSGAFKEVRSARTRLAAEKAKAESRKIELHAQRAELYALPLTPAEVKAAMVEMIDLNAAEYVRAVGALNPLGGWMEPSREYYSGERPPLSLQDVERLRLGRGHDLPDHSPLADGGLRLGRLLMPTYERFGNWTFFFFGDVLKAKLDEMLKACPKGIEAIEGDGSTLAKRREQVAGIDAELMYLNLEIARITSELIEIEQHFSVHKAEETEEQRERRMWANRLNIDPDREPERFAHELKKQQEYLGRLKEDAVRKESRSS